MELRSEGGTVLFPGQREYGGSSFFGDLSLLAVNETFIPFLFFKKRFYSSICFIKIFK